MDNIKKCIEKDAVDALNRPNPSIKDVRDVLKLVIEKMWTEERLAEHIAQVHNALCAKCPKCASDGGGKMSRKLIALIGSLVAAVVALAGAVCKMALGGAA